MRHFDAEATRARLPMPALVEALRAMFASGCEVPARQLHPVGAGMVLIMPAWREGAFLGIKTVNVFPANAALGLPRLHSVYTLFDANTGQPLAQMDGDEITHRRTVAASALAASYLARADARRLLLVGSGRVARLLPEAMRTVRPRIDEVLVWSRNPASAQALADALGGRAVVDLEAAVHQADIVSCATLASRPLVCGDWLAPGTHLDLIGSYAPTMREADGNAFARARVYVDTDEAVIKSGDVIEAIAEGKFEVAALQGTLTALCRDEAAARGDESEITLFKSVGYALEDLAAAELVWAAPR